MTQQEKANAILNSLVAVNGFYPNPTKGKPLGFQGLPRNEECINAKQCREVSVLNNWSGLTCERCPLYGKQTELPPILPPLPEPEIKPKPKRPEIGKRLRLGSLAKERGWSAIALKAACKELGIFHWSCTDRDRERLIKYMEDWSASFNIKEDTVDHTTPAIEVAKELGVNKGTVFAAARDAGIGMAGRSKEDHAKFLQAYESRKSRRNKPNSKRKDIIKQAAENRQSTVTVFDDPKNVTLESTIDKFTHWGKQKNPLVGELIREIRTRLDELERIMGS